MNFYLLTKPEEAGSSAKRLIFLAVISDLLYSFPFFLFIGMVFLACSFCFKKEYNGSCSYTIATVGMEIYTNIRRVN